MWNGWNERNGERKSRRDEIDRISLEKKEVK